MFHRVLQHVLKPRVLGVSFQINNALHSSSVLVVKQPVSHVQYRKFRLNAPLNDDTVTQPPDWKKLTNEDWAKRLSPEAYFCTREHGTEPPFSGQYVNHKAEGVYKCVCCGSIYSRQRQSTILASGWPSFYAASDEDAIIKRKDVSHGMVRTEILCTTCNSHLGHLFEDGPDPTGSRFCVNSVSLKFSPKKIH
ncbi:Peptide methionine sulfoxide reductase MsrB [Orchesella cincta]|uniref:Peptide-methionine (R)-S-oxide reductase n=1 Tax=Orchesella cincta TaxID=48709 RepID=A0A1D2MLV0_ORCCI|nr:Peptide methionine sulfoxide reductase MsrB [Orchesella cincta]